MGLSCTLTLDLKSRAKHSARHGAGNEDSGYGVRARYVALRDRVYRALSRTLHLVMAGPRPGYDDFQTRRALRVVIVNLSLVGRSARTALFLPPPCYLSACIFCATASLLERMDFCATASLLERMARRVGVIETLKGYPSPFRHATCARRAQEPALSPPCREALQGHELLSSDTEGRTGTSKAKTLAALGSGAARVPDRAGSGLPNTMPISRSSPSLSL